MEVNRGAGKHPHPHNHDQIQRHVEQIKHNPLQRRQAGGLQGGHGGCLFHDEESRVGEDEGVSRDVISAPEKAGLPAAGFESELFVDDVHGVGFKA